MKHRAFTLLEAVVVVLIVCILAAILYPVYFRATNHGGTRPVCQSNLKQIALGFKQYIQDNGEKYPPVAVAGSGYWAGSLQPYEKSWQVFQCPSEAGKTPKTTDYFFNARLAALPMKQVARATSTIALGEGSGDQLPLYHLSQLPARWADDSNSPARRHCDRANYLFVDGHAKRILPEKITLDKPDGKNATFLIR